MSGLGLGLGSGFRVRVSTCSAAVRACLRVDPHLLKMSHTRAPHTAILLQHLLGARVRVGRVGVRVRVRVRVRGEG